MFQESFGHPDGLCLPGAPFFKGPTEGNLEAYLGPQGAWSWQAAGKLLAIGLHLDFCGAQVVLLNINKNTINDQAQALHPDC